MAFNPAQQPLWPFITDIPIAGRPIDSGLSLGMTTDVLFTSSIALRYKYTHNGIETYSSTASSDGSITEQLIVAITGLTPGQEYTFIVEFAVGGGQFITSESSITLTIPSDEVAFSIIADEHMRLATIDETTDIQTALNLVEGQLCIHVGDKWFAEDFTDDDDAILVATAWRNLLRQGTIDLIVEGNHDSQALLYQDTASQNFLLNPVDQDANGKFWKVQVGPCLFIGIEPYTTSGFAVFGEPLEGDVNANTEWDISATEKALLATIATTQCPWVFIIPHQLIGGANAYGSGGGAENISAGTYQLTLHNLIKTYYALNKRIKRIFVAHGHDHMFEHYSADNIDYIQVASPNVLFTGRRTEANGYLSGTDPVGLYCEAIKGIVRASFNWHNGRIEFINLDGDILYEIGFGDTVDPTIEISTAPGTKTISTINVRGGASDG